LKTVYGFLGKSRIQTRPRNSTSQPILRQFLENRLWVSGKIKDFILDPKTRPLMLATYRGTSLTRKRLPPRTTIQGYLAHKKTDGSRGCKATDPDAKLRRLEKGWFLERTVVHRFKNEQFCGQLSLRGLDQVGSKTNSFVDSCHSGDSIQSEEGIRS